AVLLVRYWTLVLFQRCHWRFFATATVSPRRALADSFFRLSNPGSIRQFPRTGATLRIGILIPARHDRARSLRAGTGARSFLSRICLIQLFHYGLRSSLVYFTSQPGDVRDATRTGATLCSFTNIFTAKPARHSAR